MSRRIRRVSDLPDWFDRAKYDQAASLDAAGWYEQLYVRHTVSRMIKWNWPSSKWFLSALGTIRKNPIVDVLESEETSLYFFGGALRELKNNNNKPTRSPGVRLATVRDLYLIEGNIDRPEREYARKFFAQIFDDSRDSWLQPLRYKTQDWMDEPVDAKSSSDSSITVIANLSLPDRVLIEEFERILNGLRESMARGGGQPLPSPRKPNFSSWIEFGVLPYLDLFDWATENGVSIPRRVMADAIFSAGEGGEEVVRKTTAPLAKELLSERFLDLLASMAAREITERNNA